MKNKKEKEWRCLYCERVYVTNSQICPKCRRVMTLSTNENKNKHMLFDSRG